MRRHYCQIAPGMTRSQVHAILRQDASPRDALVGPELETYVFGGVERDGVDMAGRMTRMAECVKSNGTSDSRWGRFWSNYRNTLGAEIGRPFHIGRPRPAPLT